MCRPAHASGSVAGITPCHGLLLCACFTSGRCSPQAALFRMRPRPVALLALAVAVGVSPEMLVSEM